MTAEIEVFWGGEWVKPRAFRKHIGRNTFYAEVQNRVGKWIVARFRNRRNRSAWRALN